MSDFMGLLATYPVCGAQYRAGRDTVARTTCGFREPAGPLPVHPGGEYGGAAGRGRPCSGSARRAAHPAPRSARLRAEACGDLAHRRDVLVEPGHVPEVAGGEPAQFVVVLEGLGSG